MKIFKQIEHICVSKWIYFKEINEIEFIGVKEIHSTGNINIIYGGQREII